MSPSFCPPFSPFSLLSRAPITARAITRIKSLVYPFTRAAAPGLCTPSCLPQSPVLRARIPAPRSGDLKLIPSSSRASCANEYSRPYSREYARICRKTLRNRWRSLGRLQRESILLARDRIAINDKTAIISRKGQQLRYAIIRKTFPRRDVEWKIGIDMRRYRTNFARGITVLAPRYHWDDRMRIISLNYFVYTAFKFILHRDDGGGNENRRAMVLRKNDLPKVRRRGRYLASLVSEISALFIRVFFLAVARC